MSAKKIADLYAETWTLGWIGPDMANIFTRSGTVLSAYSRKIGFKDTC